MSREFVYRCDGPECERFVQKPTASAEPFLEVIESVDRSLHFCGWDCLLRLAATKPPAELVVPED